MHEANQHRGVALRCGVSMGLTVKGKQGVLTDALAQEEGVLMADLKIARQKE